jgi:hypothetical protein
LRRPLQNITLWERVSGVEEPRKGLV